MATKKKRRRSSRAKKINPNGLLLFLALLMVTLTSLGLYHYLSGSSHPVSPPLFEEMYSVASDLDEKIRGVDDAIYEALYRVGVPEGDVLFSAVQPRHERGREWEFTALQIVLSDRNDALELDRIIKERLSRVGPAVSYEKVKVSGRRIVCRVSALGFPTHRIEFVYNGYREAPSGDRPKVAIIIDDLGYDLEMGRAFAAQGLPLTLSLLPMAPHTEEIAREAGRRGCELILHLPMEPKDYPRLNPGPGALLTGMNEEEILEKVRGHLDRVAGIRGVNHHMGSLFTQRQDKMEIVLSELKRRGLFYVDSRTTTRTVAFETAKKIGLPTARRGVFLDNDLSPRAIGFQMERLLGMARHLGGAVGIAHPHGEVLKVLRQYSDRLKSDYRVVPVSDLVG